MAQSKLLSDLIAQVFDWKHLYEQKFDYLETPYTATKYVPTYGYSVVATEYPIKHALRAARDKVNKFSVDIDTAILFYFIVNRYAPLTPDDPPVDESEYLIDALFDAGLEKYVSRVVDVMQNAALVEEAINDVMAQVPPSDSGMNMVGTLRYAIAKACPGFNPHTAAILYIISRGYKPSPGDPPLVETEYYRDRLKEEKIEHCLNDPEAVTAVIQRITDMIHTELRAK